MRKTGESTSGIFTIKEYEFEKEPDFLRLIRRLQNGPGEVQEVVSYVFEGEDPLGVDARSFSPEEFVEICPGLESYGPGLAFDVIVRTEGHPLTVELTQGSRAVTTNSLDRDLDLENLLGEEDQAMSPGDLLAILHVAEKLKCQTRHCDTSSGRRESVAEHSWRAALLAMLLSSEKDFSSYDMNRVIRMCLIHDLGEAFTGDIPSFEKTEADTSREEEALRGWIGTFPASLKKEFQGLFEEMRALKTPEARLYKAIDKLEAVIQHNESDISSWLPLEYDLQLTYGREEVKDFPWMTALKDQIDAWTREKISGVKS